MVTTARLPREAVFRPKLQPLWRLGLGSGIHLPGIRRSRRSLGAGPRIVTVVVTATQHQPIAQKQQCARHIQPGHAGASAKICARTRAAAPRATSAGGMRIALSEPVLACLERLQALSAWRATRRTCAALITALHALECQSCPPQALSLPPCMLPCRLRSASHFQSHHSSPCRTLSCDSCSSTSLAVTPPAAAAAA